MSQRIKKIMELTIQPNNIIINVNDNLETAYNVEIADFHIEADLNLTVGLNNDTTFPTAANISKNSLPPIESHYCRSTTKKYLMAERKSKQALYKCYVEDLCKTRDVTPLSISSFNTALNLRNIALFRPNKDECEKCAEVGQVSEIDYQLQSLKNNEARLEKKNDTRNETYIFTETECQ
ncbi:unnamed protein product [Psylliodes chrysocephalus]|uniref:Uncharacterized protein n=1 Tax=Psylliodes chrysocephalus TaxID=3402493 RepID=A0A9P0DBW1_9CUCU|nr:unnamed protein product [Psylliodes chrysocephala]